MCLPRRSFASDVSVGVAGCLFFDRAAGSRGVRVHRLHHPASRVLEVVSEFWGCGTGGHRHWCHSASFRFRGGG